MRINVLGTYHLFAAAEANGVKRFALASTCCAFGIFFAHHPWDPHYLPMDEKHPALPQDMYALSKRCNEETAAAFTRRSGMTTAALRLTTVMNFASVSPWTRRWLRNDEDRRNDLWSYIEVTDVARAYQCAIEKAKEGTHTTAIIAARDSFTTHDIRHLVQKHFPLRAGDVADLAPTQSLYDTGVAEEAFGFVAQRNWRDVPELHGDGA
jgi:nucleoside-diphosphate-sugar epimerase